MLDDKWGLDALTKLTGQIAAAGVMVLLGVQLAFLFLPVADIGTLSLGPDIGVPLTILLTVLTVNALNFIDGLDGLAAGVSAIAALAFFAYSYHLGLTGYDDVASAPALITAVLAGACLGFLPHNFSPARIFMGDSGSMLVGLMLSAAAVTATGQSTRSPSTPRPACCRWPCRCWCRSRCCSSRSSTWSWPSSGAPARASRRSRRTRCTCTTGCCRSGTRTVAPCWSCTSGPRCSPSARSPCRSSGAVEVLVAIAVLLVVGVVVVLSPRARRAASEARAAELAAQRERSRAEHPTARALRLGDPPAPAVRPRQPADRQVVP